MEKKNDLTEEERRATQTGNYQVKDYVLFVVIVTLFVMVSIPLYFQTSPQLASYIMNIILTISLVFVYSGMLKQEREKTKIQKSQNQILSDHEDIMEMEYEPRIRVGIEVRGNIPYVVIHNTGKATGLELSIEWSIGDTSNDWYTPFAPSGKVFSEPLMTEISERRVGRSFVDNEVLVNGEDVLERLEFRDHEPVLKYKIRYKSVVGEEFSFEGHVDAEKAIKMGSTESTKYRSREGSLDEIADEISELRQQIRRTFDEGRIR